MSSSARLMGNTLPAMLFKFELSMREFDALAAKPVANIVDD
jgi:hypothetical protein